MARQHSGFDMESIRKMLEITGRRAYQVREVVLTVHSVIPKNLYKFVFLAKPLSEN